MVATLKPLELVIVDDEPRIAQALEREIRLKYTAAEMIIRTFENPVESLAHINDRKNDIFMVISDLRMPGMNGAELLESVRAANPDVQTTLLTAYSDMDDIRRAVSANIRSLLAKPWNQGRLYEEVEGALTEFRLRKENERLREELSRQLKTAGEFQNAILSGHDELPAYPLIDIEYRPLERMGCGGDYFDVFTLRDGRVIMLLGDVSGHGIKPALVTVMLKTIIQGRRLIGDFIFASPTKFLTVLNGDLCRFLSASPDTLIAFAAVFLDPRTKTISISNAGLPSLVVADKAGLAKSFSQDGTALAFSPDTVYQEHTVFLEAGDSLVMTSDGLTENDEKGLTVSEGETQDLLATMLSSKIPARSMVDRFRNSHPSARFSDDVTVLVARF